MSDPSAGVGNAGGGLTTDAVAADLDTLDAYIKAYTSAHNSPRPPEGQAKTDSIIPGQPQLDAGTVNTEMLIVLLNAVMNKLNLLSSQAEELFLQNKQEIADKKHEENKQKAEELRKKAEKAKKSGLLAKIFTWIAVALAVLAASIIAVASFGAGAPLVAMAAVGGAALAVTVTVLSETGAMDKMMGPIADGFTKMFIAMGMDPKKAKLAGMITAQVTVAVVIMAMQIAMSIASGGAGTATMVTTLINRFAAISAAATKVAATTVSTAVTAAQVASASSQIAASSANMAAATYKKEGEEIKADQVDIQALIKMLNDKMEIIRDFMKRLIALLAENTASSNEIIELAHQSRQTVISGQKNYA
ncbi:MAG: type III secretion system translocon subunit SctE [Betaproteobacteria bacterium]|nr:type III secretion system translocon subunit SctE [Betaproteobacteria bacterium]